MNHSSESEDTVDEERHSLCRQTVGKVQWQDLSDQALRLQRDDRLDDCADLPNRILSSRHLLRYLNSATHNMLFLLQELDLGPPISEILQCGFMSSWRLELCRAHWSMVRRTAARNSLEYVIMSRIVTDADDPNQFKMAETINVGDRRSILSQTKPSPLDTKGFTSHCKAVLARTYPHLS